MSITVRLWGVKDLQSLRTDKWLATIFMNRKTFSNNELNYYPYSLRRTYLCMWAEEPESVTIYATDEKMLWKFIDAEYTKRPDTIHQVITQYRPINTYDHN